MNHKPCPVCGSIWHSRMYHNPRKPLPRATKSIRHEAVKTHDKRKSTERAWFEANPPDSQGYWYCYISKHPLCQKMLTRETITLEHNLSKARRPDLIYDITNLFPACSYDNKAKGSLSAEEYMQNR